VAVIGKVPLSTLRHAVPSYPTVSEIWLRLLETLRAQRPAADVRSSMYSTGTRRARRPFIPSRITKPATDAHGPVTGQPGPVAPVILDTLAMRKQPGRRGSSRHCRHTEKRSQAHPCRPPERAAGEGTPQHVRRSGHGLATWRFGCCRMSGTAGPTPGGAWQRQTGVGADLPSLPRLRVLRGGAGFPATGQAAGRGAADPACSGAAGVRLGVTIPRYGCGGAVPLPWWCTA